MDLANIPINVTYLAALSLAAERLTDIAKGLCGERCAKKHPAGEVAPATDYRKAQADEAKRTATINGISVVAGIVTAAVAYEIKVLPVAANWGEVFIFGVLAGAGSGFWNAVLSYVLQLKNTLPIKAGTPSINLVMQAPSGFAAPDDGRNRSGSPQEEKTVATAAGGR